MTDAHEPRSIVDRTGKAAFSLLVDRSGTSLKQVESEFPYFADPETGD
jgi:hypothetical protein